MWPPCSWGWCWCDPRSRWSRSPPSSSASTCATFLQSINWDACPQTYIPNKNIVMCVRGNVTVLTFCQARGWSSWSGCRSCPRSSSWPSQWCPAAAGCSQPMHYCYQRSQQDFAIFTVPRDGPYYDLQAFRLSRLKLGHLSKKIITFKDLCWPNCLSESIFFERPSPGTVHCDISRYHESWHDEDNFHLIVHIEGCILEGVWAVWHEVVLDHAARPEVDPAGGVAAGEHLALDIQPVAAAPVRLSSRALLSTLDPHVFLCTRKPVHVL